MTKRSYPPSAELALHGTMKEKGMFYRCGSPTLVLHTLT